MAGQRARAHVPGPACELRRCPKLEQIDALHKELDKGPAKAKLNPKP
jgi:hypothetical protein